MVTADWGFPLSPFLSLSVSVSPSLSLSASVFLIMIMFHSFHKKQTDASLVVAKQSLKQAQKKGNKGIHFTFPRRSPMRWTSAQLREIVFLSKLVKRTGFPDGSAAKNPPAMQETWV